MGPTAAFFDLDKTIIAKSSTLAFSKPFQAGGLISRRAVLKSVYAQFVFLVGGADHDQMEKLRAFMSSLVAGWDVATVREIVAEVREEPSPSPKSGDVWRHDHPPYPSVIEPEATGYTSPAVEEPGTVSVPEYIYQDNVGVSSGRKY